jgi:hypothetical protein
MREGGERDKETEGERVLNAVLNEEREGKG